MIPSYPSIHALGHRALVNLFDGPVLAQEKIDGSQFSFGVIDGELKMRSKGAEIYPDNPPKLFKDAVITVQSIAHLLHPNWVYRGEYLQKPHHNALTYDRIPKGHIILFDVQAEGQANFLSPSHLFSEAERIGLELVPFFVCPGKEWSPEVIEEVLETTSVLGGAQIEGLVFKNYRRFGLDHHPLFGKYVSEAFKEVHKGSWKAANPSRNDVVAGIVRDYTTPARWQKAIVHLRERGELQDSPRDIGPLMREVNEDVLKECEEEIKERLWKFAWPQISRGITKGLPEWYKTQLLKNQFSSADTTDESNEFAPTG